MKERHWGLFLFFIIMLALLALGVYVFYDALQHPTPNPMLVLPRGISYV